MRRGWPRLLVCVCLLAGPMLFGLPSVAQDSEDGEDFSLTLERDYVVGNATLLVGGLTFEDARLAHPFATRAQELRLGPGRLLACPIESAQGPGVIARLRDLDNECPGGELFTSPLVTFGARTWIRLVGNYTLDRAPLVALAMLVPDGPDTPGRPAGAPFLAAVPANKTLPFTPLDPDVRFAPILSSSQVTVVPRFGDTRTFNGTEWGFVFDRATSFNLTAEAFGGTPMVEPRLLLSRTPVARLSDILRPHDLLDVQEAALGADAREPVENVTRHFANSRLPHFRAGALIGNINGTIDGVDLAGRAASLVRFHEARLRLAGTSLDGDGDADLVITTAGVRAQGEGPDDAPRILPVLLWILAVVAFVFGRRATRSDRWTHIVDASAPILLFLFWDRLLAALLGTSAIDIATGSEGGFGDGLRLLAFELIAFLAAAALLWLPVRFGLARVAPQRYRSAVAGVAAVWFLLYLWLDTDSILALGLRFARL